MSAKRLNARVEPSTAFGAKLRELRDRRGYSQAQLAEVLGYSREYLSDYERGRHWPGRRNVADLDRALQARGELARAYALQEIADLVAWLETFQ